MKKYLSKLIMIFLGLVLLTSCSPEEKYIKAKDDPEITKLFKVNPPSDTRRLSNYKYNLDISRNISYFDTSDSVPTKKLHIETPVPDKGFFVRNIYYYQEQFTTVVIVHVSDQIGTTVRGLDVNNSQLLSGSVEFGKLKLWKGTSTGFNPKKSDIVVVVVYNDNGQLIPKEIMRPEEAGGGVIAGKP